MLILGFYLLEKGMSRGAAHNRGQPKRHPFLARLATCIKTLEEQRTVSMARSCDTLF